MSVTIDALHHLIARALGFALPHIEYPRGKTLVIKLGGSTLEYERDVLQDIVRLHTLGAHPVLVPGLGPSITAWLSKLGIPTHFENGLRTTDEETLEVVRMVRLARVNQSLVLMAVQLGGKAVGLSGTNGHMVRAHIVDERMGNDYEIDTGDPAAVQALTRQGSIPVVALLGADENGAYLNINADQVAAHPAGALFTEKLIVLSNEAFIRRPDGSLISELSEEGGITGGMIPKVSAALHALSTVPRVPIIDGRESHVLLRELFTDQSAGTMIQRSSKEAP
jgi:acetylglutamate kinase